MSVNVGDTVRVLSIPEEVVEYGLEEFGVDATELIGQEATVKATTEGRDPFMLMLMGVPEDAVWIEWPEAPHGELGLSPSEYELVAA